MSNNLRGVPLAKMDLSGKDLSGKDLSGKDLSGMDLSGIILTGANLTGANLTATILTGVILTGANLTGANLTDADLSGADLTDADLSGADLTKAIIKETIFRNTNISGTIFNNVQLSDAKILDVDLTTANLSGAGLSGSIASLSIEDIRRMSKNHRPTIFQPPKNPSIIRNQKLRRMSSKTSKSTSKSKKEKCITIAIVAHGTMFPDNIVDTKLFDGVKISSASGGMGMVGIHGVSTSIPSVNNKYDQHVSYELKGYRTYIENMLNLCLTNPNINYSGLIEPITNIALLILLGKRKRNKSE